MTDRRILIIGNYPPPYGGVPHHIERLGAHLAGRGWSCNVLSGGTTGVQRIGGISVHKPSYARKLVGWARGRAVRQLHDWLGGGTLAQDHRALWRRYSIYADVGAQIVRECDIQLIASYNLLSYAPVGAWLAHEYGLPHVISIFGEIYKYPEMSRRKGFFAGLCERAFRVLSCSEHCGKSLRLLGADRDVRPVTYGVNVEHFSPDLRAAQRLRTEFDIGDAPVVLFVGRLGSEMGLDSFLAAAEILSVTAPNARFVMVGQQGDLATAVAKRCEVSGGRLLLMPNVPYAELPSYYRLADVLVVPTRGTRTCSSLAAMEAMATGKPVVAFAVGGIPEIVEDGRTGLLVAPEDCNGLAEAIERLLTDPVLRNQLAESGFRQAQAHFDERQVNETMERHFLDALAAP